LITSVVAVGSLALVLAADATAAPTPSFTVNPTSAYAGCPVTLTSTSTASTGQIVDNLTLWNIDGVEESGPSMTHTFASAATYEGTLQVTDEDPLDPTATLPLSIVVNPAAPPIAEFAVPQSQPVPNAPTTFTASPLSADPGCTITRIEWAFDSGPFVQGGETVTHPFTEAGMHTVRLRVQDSRTPRLATVASHDVYVNTPPFAGFNVFPGSPLVGENVNLNSTSSDVEGEPLQQWDLNGNGVYGETEDASGRFVTGKFTDAGTHTVSLLVTDSQGATATARKDIVVRPSPMLQPIPNQPSQPSSNNPPSKGNPAPATTQQPFLRLLTPFPVVRLQGAVVQRGTRVRRLTVRAPKGSRVFVYCRGKRCPAKRLTKLANRGTLRFRALERVLPVGSLVQVFVRRGDQIGKYTSFLMRRKKVPKRIDGCVLPSSPRAVTCPED
jgi:PKD repeat protein